MNHLKQLEHLEKKATTEQVLAFFDSLPVVKIEDMMGRWHGRGLKTDHNMDGLLERFGWYGKEFDGAESAHPLLFKGFGKSLFAVNPAFVPMQFVRSFGPLLNNFFFKFLFLVFGRLAQTTKHKARLRMVQYRGKYSATMIYDALPTNDHFRQVNEHTLLGIMDLRNDTQKPFCFILIKD